MATTLSTRARFLAAYLRPQRRRLATLAFLLGGNIALQLLNPQIMRDFIDTATTGGTDQALLTAAALFIAIALVQQLLSVGATYVSENLGWVTTNSLRADLLLHCLRLDQSFHKSRTPGELIERIDGDVSALANFFSQFVIQILGNLLLLLGVLLLLWGIDWRVGATLSAFALAVLLVLAGIQRVVVPHWKVARQSGAELYGFLEERLSGTEDIRSNGAQAYTMRRLYERLTTQFRAERTARLLARTAWVSSDLLFAVGTGAIFALGAYLFSRGSMTIGTIYLIFFYNGLLIRPLIQITRQVEDLQKASAGIVRVQELLDVRSALPDTGTATLGDGALEVTFDHVGFSYDTVEPVLDGVSFHLRAGDVLGVLGRTGSGKTTLTRLLFRLYDPQQGAILLGGTDIRQVPLGELRRRVGIVTQDVQLFHATLRDNLTLFDRTLSDERIMEAIDILGLRSWYDAQDQGLDTMLASGTGSLSAGEGQLLAFTRIFLHDPGLVILDEASSRLDPATETLIERAVDRLMAGRTGIIIAHRLHTVHRANEILILENGVVAEYGDRERLMRDPGSRFAMLLQTGLEEALA